MQRGSRIWRQAFFFCFLVAFLAGWVQPAGAAWLAPAGAGPRVMAAAAVLFDVGSGLFLWGKNPDLRREPASTTKVLTALLTAERCDLNEIVTVSPLAARTGGSSAYLRAGEQLRVRDLLYAMLLVSGNDAATALAEHVGGSVAGFAELMNERAAQLGAASSHFANPHGLPNPEHYTTAHDLALIACQALQNPVVSEIVSCRSETIPRAGGDGRQTLNNINRLLRSYEGADGVKTGYTRAAGRCLISSATRDGRQVIAVVLGSSSIWDDSRAVLDYAFSGFSPLTLVQGGQTLVTLRPEGAGRDVDLVAARDLVVPLPHGADAELFWQTSVQWQEDCAAPLRAGQVLGCVLASPVGGGETVAVDLVAATNAERQRGWLGGLARSLYGVWEGLRDRLPRRPLPAC